MKDIKDMTVKELRAELEKLGADEGTGSMRKAKLQEVLAKARKAAEPKPAPKPKPAAKKPAKVKAAPAEEKAPKKPSKDDIAEQLQGKLGMQTVDIKQGKKTITLSLRTYRRGLYTYENSEENIVIGLTR